VDDLNTIVANAKAVVEGHYVLRSGLHAKSILKTHRIASRPAFVERLADRLANKLLEELPSEGMPIENILTFEQRTGIFAFALGLALSRLQGKEPVISLVGSYKVDSGEYKERLLVEDSLKPEDRVLVFYDKRITGGNLAVLERILVDEMDKGKNVNVVGKAVLFDFSNFLPEGYKAASKVISLSDDSDYNITFYDPKSYEGCLCCRQNVSVVSCASGGLT
jgi:adenine/guanine phosphoribosyltransferase-like PRPP-binding protein